MKPLFALVRRGYFARDSFTVFSGATLLLLVGAVFFAGQLHAQDLATTPTVTTTSSSSSDEKAEKAKPDYEPMSKVIEGFTQVISTTDGKSFYKLWRRDKDNQMLAQLPKEFAGQKHYIALTVASGDIFAGLQAGERYVYWKKIGKRLALIEPNMDTRSSGDAESKASVKRLYTDRVIVDVPILAHDRNQGPVIDLDELLVGKARDFFGSQVGTLNKNLASIENAKAFPENVEVAFEIPGTDGQLQTLHYSISLIPDNKDYKSRDADARVGYFITTHNDYGKFKEDETVVRFINRWHLEKADKNLKLSPPKDPIVFYIEHTTPIRYRRWVRDGILMWNKAFEEVGLIDAIEVRQQDAASDAHMDKDPEDVRYNFVRWLNNGIGIAIGPSRVNPETGQILDADIILSDGWIRYWWRQYNELIPEIALQGFTPQTLSWLEQNPRWDPRIRLAPPYQRQQIIADRAMRGSIEALGGHPAAKVDENFIGDEEYDGLLSRYGQKNGMCMAANWKSHGIALYMMSLETALATQAEEQAIAAAKKDDDDDEDGEEKDDDADEDDNDDEEKEQLVDGIPETFIGPLLADLVAHEVGHTLGLRHNFKGSSLYTFKDINSEDVAGKKPFASTVMDYVPVNISVDGGELQGDWGMIDVGPYDIWAIEYGYSFKENLKPILARVADPALQYATDEDTWGPDPLARRYDFGKDPLAYAKDQMRLIRKHRGDLIDKFVKDGQSWAKARRGYEMTLSAQLSSIGMMANWVGGTHVYRDKKGDKNGRAPLEVVPVKQQREALRFVVENAFPDKSYGLTPEILRHMTVDKWWDDSSMFEDPTWPVHDRILGIQAYALTALLGPTTLERVYDNEFRVPADEDALTLDELMGTIHDAVWGPLQAFQEDGKYTPRKPLLSSIERNLQQEYIERLIDLIDPEVGTSPAYKPISDLAASRLKQIKREIAPYLSAKAPKGKVVKRSRLDAYSLAHLEETSTRIGKALEARYVYEIGQNSSYFVYPFFKDAGGEAGNAAR